MRFLGALARLVEPGGRRDEVAAKALGYKAADVGDRSLRQVGRIGAHISDQADAAGTTQLDALVELLRQGHRTAGAVAESPRSLLLEGAGREWRRRAPMLVAAADGLDGIGS